MKGFLGLEKGSFAEGLALFDHKNSLYEKVRINQNAKNLIFEAIDDFKSNTSITFDDDELGEKHLHRFLLSMDWIEQSFNRSGKFNYCNQSLNIEIAITLYFWIVTDLKFYHLCDDHDFNIALQWILNKITKKYSIRNLVEYDK